MKVVVVGDVVVEVSARIETSFTALSQDCLQYAPVQFAVGGSAANFALAAAQHDCEVVLAGAIGTDALGEVVLSTLERAGSAARYLGIPTSRPESGSTSGTASRTDLMARGCWSSLSRPHWTVTARTRPTGSSRIWQRRTSWSSTATRSGGSHDAR